MSDPVNGQRCDSARNPYPFYAPRFWAGMRISDYVGLLNQNRFRVHPLRWPMMGLVGGCCVASSLLGTMQNLICNRKIEAVELPDSPIFVIGHWRSGTTLLHELLSMDEQFTYPTTFQCFVPGHHVLSRPFLQPLVRLLLPGKRPMDSMLAGPELPQEDEFALVGLGAPSPYRQLAFCNEPAPHIDMLNLNHADPKEIEQLRRSLTWFYKSVTYRNNKQLILKSPTHTGRIGHLVKWFPNARFVHISRHPYKVFPSTVHLWKSLAAVQSYQFPAKDESRLADYVHRCYREMYDGYFQQIKEIPAENIMQVSFEQLVENPVRQIQSIYETWNLEGFDQARPRVEKYWSQRKSHRINKTHLSEETRAEIDEIWSDYMDQFGYRHSQEPEKVLN